MRSETVWVSLVALSVGFALTVIGGVICLSPSYFPSLSELFLSVLEAHAKGIGGFIALLGLLLMGVCTRFCRRPYLSLQMGGVSIYQEVLTHLISNWFKQLCPNEPVSCQVCVSKNKQLEITVQLPLNKLDDAQLHFQAIENGLSTLLSEQCGFHEPFVLHAHFI
jgi:hypothetical protein